MPTIKENFLIAAKGGKPEWVPNFPAESTMYCPSLWDVDKETMRDWTGARWIEDAAGMTCDTANPPLLRVSEWREKVIFPDISKFDWAGEISRFMDEQYDPNKIVNTLIDGGPSIFTRPIHTLGWEEGLAAHYEEPEEMKAYIDAFTDLMIGIIDNVTEHITPDIISTGDDFSFASGPFISKAVWDAFYKDNMQRIIDRIHEKGALAQFHNCGDNGYLLDECMALGVDIMELPIPNKELEEAKKKYGSRLVIVGGWDRIGEASKDENASEEIVRQSVRDAMDIYAKDGAFIFWDGGLVVIDDKTQKKMDWLNDEVEKYGHIFYK